MSELIPNPRKWERDKNYESGSPKTKPWMQLQHPLSVYPLPSSNAKADKPFASTSFVLGLNEGFPIWLNKLCILAQCIIREIPPTGPTRIKKVSRVSAGSHITGHLSITLPCLFDIGKSSKERLVRQALMLIDF
uniref:Uncharacterized protein n=1 Tax=Opuntia streptacantha TaxID=393608 RepID=A0A7C9DCF8_OPUST